MKIIWLIIALAPMSTIAGCKDEEQPEGYSKVTPTNLPGATVKVLEPLKLTEKARIPENDPAYKRVEIFKDKLVFHYSSKPTIALEPEHVVAGGDTIGYLRKVVSVNKLAETKIEVSTKSAYVGEFILSGHFRVTHEPLAKDWENAGGDIMSRSYPLGPENNYSIFKKFGKDPALQCTVKAGASLKVEPVLEITPKIVMDVKFAPAERWFHLVGEMVYAEFSVGGTIVAGVDIDAKAALSATCTTDFIGVLRKNSGNPQLFKMWLPTLRFSVGPVPVVITHYMEPIVKSQLGAKLTLAQLKASARLNLGLVAGTKYENKKWSPIWKPSRSGSLSVNVGDSTGEASVSEGMSVGYQYVGLLYSTAGPKLGLQLTGTETIKATPMTCKWSADLSFGVDLVYGAELQVPVLDKKIWDVSGKASLFKKKITETGGLLPNCYADAGPEAGLEMGIEMGVDVGVDLAADAALVDAVTDVAPPDGPVAETQPVDGSAGAACTPKAGSGWLFGNQGVSSPPNITVSGGNGSSISQTGGACAVALVKGDTIRVAFITSKATSSLVSNYGGGAFIITRQPPADPTTIHTYDVSVKPTGSFGNTSITWAILNPNGINPLSFKYTLGITPGP